MNAVGSAAAQNHRFGCKPVRYTMAAMRRDIEKGVKYFLNHRPKKQARAMHIEAPRGTYN